MSNLVNTSEYNNITVYLGNNISVQVLSVAAGDVYTSLLVQTCNAGFYVNSSVTACTLCPVNTFTAAPSGAYCSDCTAQYFGNDTGMTFCYYCGDGFYYDQSICKKCPLGTYMSTTHCQLCGPATYSTLDVGTVCTLCPANTYSNSMGLVNISQCKDCAENTTSTAGSTACYICPPGTFWQTGGCLPCQTGTYNSEHGQQVCQNCTVGTYNDQLGQSGCLMCPPGYTSGTGAATCSVTILPMVTYYEISVFGWVFHSMVLIGVVMLCFVGSKKMWVKASIKQIMRKIGMQIKGLQKKTTDANEKYS